MVTIARISHSVGAAGWALISGRRRSLLGAPPLPALIPALLVAAAMALPVVYLIVRGASASDQAWDLLFRVRTLETLWRTLLLIGCVTALSAAIAVPFAWLTTRTDLPFRRAWTVLAALPLVIPSFVGAFLYISALGPKGLLQSGLEVLFGVERLPDLYGLVGATAVLTLLSYPYLFLTVRGSVANLDPATEEASRGLGHGAWSTFYRVTLPQLRPSIAAGSLLVALYTLSEFGAVALLRYDTFTFIIYQQYEGSIDRSIAALLSFVLVLMAVVILLAENYTRGRGRYYRSGGGSARMPAVIKLGRWKWAAMFAMGAVLLLALVLPVGVLTYWLLRGLNAGEPLLLLWDATKNSLLVSAAASIVTAAMAIAMAVLLVRFPTRLNRVLEPISFTGYALPGVVVALALVFFGARYVRPLYQTHYLLIFAYAVLFFPVALGSVRSALLQISPRLEDAARCLGYNPPRVMMRVTLPLMRSGVLMGAALVFLLTMKELPATLILGPLDFKTLATSVWGATQEAFFAQAAAPALMIILTSSIPLTLLALREKRTLA
ncbi:MAG: iron ABC transporter permease [Chloroflexota bacterium]|nr:iron ABC transporter permease [Chloroflexota bacterium]